jgi:demethylmenaquinone methyltransferase / 2-methoxy-6-polyprenyl-1,4-benzoquinol methylase
MDDKLAPIESYDRLVEYFPDPGARPAFTRELFDETARHYELINQICSFGSGNRYRRHELLRAGLRPGLEVLDVAVGTGLVARAAAEITGDSRAIIGLDMSMGMLTQVRRKLEIRLIRADAERLPLVDQSVDFVSMGYALRHIGDLNNAFREYRRVLRSGGKLLILELARPESRSGRLLMKAYMKGVAPLICRALTGSKSVATLMEYYWDTIEHCIPAATITNAISEAGFVDAACCVEYGTFRTYSGIRAE